MFWTIVFKLRDQGCMQCGYYRYVKISPLAVRQPIEAEPSILIRGVDLFLHSAHVRVADFSNYLKLLSVIIIE